MVYPDFLVLKSYQYFIYKVFMRVFEVLKREEKKVDFMNRIIHH